MSNYFGRLLSPRTADRLRRLNGSETSATPSPSPYRADQDTDADALFFAHLPTHSGSSLTQATHSGTTDHDSSDLSQNLHRTRPSHLTRQHCDSMSKRRRHRNPDHRRVRTHPYSSLPRSQPQRQVPIDLVDESNESVHVHIKTEEEQEPISRIPVDERVSIFVGQHNKIFTVSLESLDKSPTLRSLVSRQGGGDDGSGNGNGTSTGTGAEGTFIMHPKLTSIDPDHFAAVQQFLLADEYIPAIVSTFGVNDDRNALSKTLDGVDSLEDYRSETVRAAQLYVLAKRLGMVSMAQLVKRKITECGYTTASVGVKCLLDVSMVIFSRPDDADGGIHVVLQSNPAGHSQSDVKAKNGKGMVHDGLEKEKEKEKNADALEEWLISVLAMHFQAMMTSHSQFFFEVASHGAVVRRQFQRRILQRRIENLKTLGEAVLIEDDE
ncbi:hypothetical protein RBB50_006021 [Rhinocladiella similis]